MNVVPRSMAPLISAADIMACFVGALLLVLQTERMEIREEREKARQEVVAAEEHKQRLDAEIEELRKKKWKLIATQWRLGKSEKIADASLYCFKDGVFPDPQSRDPMTDAEIAAWIKSRPKSAKRLYLVVENGANDSMLRSVAAISASGRFSEYSLLTLPSDLDPRN